MFDQLIIRILSEPVEPIRVQWAIYRGSAKISGPFQGDTASLKDSLAQLYPEGLKLRVHCLVPTQWVGLHQVVMPNTQARVLAKALPFKLEDQLADDVEDCHFCQIGKPQQQIVSVAVVKKSVLRYWLAAFEDQDFDIETMLPDALCLPLEHSATDSVGSVKQELRWGLLVEYGHVLLKTQPDVAYAFTVPQIPMMLDAVFDQQGLGDQGVNSTTGLTLTLLNEEGDAQAAQILTRLVGEIESAQLEEPITVERRLVPATTFELLAAGFLKSQSQRKMTNLLSGEFKQDIKRAGLNVKWHAFAALLSVCLLGQVAYMSLQGAAFKEKSDNLYKESVAVYKRYFPNERRIVNLKRQLDAKLRTAKKGPDDSNKFLPLLERVGDKIYGLNKSKKSSIDIKRIRYDHRQGVLRLELSAIDFPMIERFKAQLEGSGVQVTQEAAKKTDNGRVTSRFQVKQV